MVLEEERPDWPEGATVNDEPLIEFLAKWLQDNTTGDGPEMTLDGLRIEARALVRDLRADGFEVYRPEDCALAHLEGLKSEPDQQRGWFRVAEGRLPLMHAPAWKYRLVPVEDE